jgi:hypothetical protein
MATGEVIDREMNANELATYKATQNADKAQADALAAKAAAREALLTKLGITADEAQLLLGGM